MKGVKCVKETETLKLANYKKDLKKWNLQGRPFIIRFTGRERAYFQGTLYMPDAFFSISSWRALC